jgi:hypothetical protein
MTKKKLIETIIGAAIWYLPHGEKYWTGKISLGALELKKDNPKKNLSKEHEFPRKKAAEELLNFKLDEIRDNDDLLVKLYEGKYSKFNYVTSSENKKVSKFQKTEDFIDPERAYKEANIQLIEISKDELKKIKKGDKEYINNLIKKLPPTRGVTNMG